jgi:hypothetical protein
VHVVSLRFSPRDVVVIDLRELVQGVDTYLSFRVDFMVVAVSSRLYGSVPGVIYIYIFPNFVC